MPNLSNCFVDWSTWRIDFASSLIAINEAYGGGSSLFFNHDILFLILLRVSLGVGVVY